MPIAAASVVGMFLISAAIILGIDIKDAARIIANAIRKEKE